MEYLDSLNPTGYAHLKEHLLGARFSLSACLFLHCIQQNIMYIESRRLYDV